MSDTYVRHLRMCLTYLLKCLTYLSDISSHTHTHTHSRHVSDIHSYTHTHTHSLATCVWHIFLHTHTHSLTRDMCQTYRDISQHVSRISFLDKRRDMCVTCVWHISHVSDTSVICQTHESCVWHIANPSTYQLIQPMAHSVAQHLEILPKHSQLSTRRTRIPIRFIIYYLVLIANPMGRILVRWKRFRNHLEMLCHTTCNAVCQTRPASRVSRTCQTHTPWVAMGWLRIVGSLKL